MSRKSCLLLLLSVFFAGCIVPLYYHVRFDDGALTLNDTCPVRDLPLGPMKSPIFVNGRPVGFC